MQISIKSFGDLTVEQQEEASNNGGGKEWAGYLCVEHEGKAIACVSDAMEPEDATFSRDLSWVPSLLRKVYQIGLQSV